MRILIGTDGDVLPQRLRISEPSLHFEQTNDITRCHFRTIVHFDGGLDRGQVSLVLGSPVRQNAARKESESKREQDAQLETLLRSRTYCEHVVHYRAPTRDTPAIKVRLHMRERE